MCINDMGIAAKGSLGEIHSIRLIYCRKRFLWIPHWCISIGNMNISRGSKSTGWLWQLFTYVNHSRQIYVNYLKHIAVRNENEDLSALGFGHSETSFNLQRNLPSSITLSVLCYAAGFWLLLGFLQLTEVFLAFLHVLLRETKIMPLTFYKLLCETLGFCIAMLLQMMLCHWCHKQWWIHQPSGAHLWGRASPAVVERSSNSHAKRSLLLSLEYFLWQRECENIASFITKDINKSWCWHWLQVSPTPQT